MPGRTGRLLLATLLLALACTAGPARAQDAAPVKNRPPTGTFSWSPADVHSGDTVTFTAVASDPDGDAVTATWDLDGDGRFEATGNTATGRWIAPGQHIVSLLLVDARGNSTTVRRPIDVTNAPPEAVFTMTPTAPVSGNTVNFTSYATDPDGGSLNLAQAWDLDGDGAFDDAQGPTARATFLAGDHIIRLQVTDATGATNVAEQHLIVRDQPPAPAPATPAVQRSSSPALLSPFPVVRLSGRITRFGVRVTSLTVWGPRGARVTVRCTGTGCPRPGLLRRVVPSRGPRLVRIRPLGNVLAPGARLAVRVTQSGLVGKYTAFRIRRGAPPIRRDRCLPPGVASPRPCR